MLKNRFIDKTGDLSKLIALKRLEKYTNEIEMVITKYNKKSCNETMMIKGVRKSKENTTNRKTHAEELALIAVQIAKGLKLNKAVVKIMGDNHDIGHTFFGHSGEWWISNILRNYGLGNFSHNTLGVAELNYTHEIYNEIIEKIKVHNPKISDKKLSKIKNSLWLIMDAINSHNGEKVDLEFTPDFQKKEEDFNQEILRCFTVKGYDRRIIPATSEACLMRLADKIAYIPLDMVDGIREGLVRDEEGNVIDYLDYDYQKILLKLGITQEEIDIANTKKEFSKITEKIKTIFINDVIQNSSKKRIRMSEKIMSQMTELLQLNNQKAVNYVLLKEDQETYPPVIKSLIDKFSNIILKNNLLEKLQNASKNMDINSELKEYKRTPYEQFAEYLCNMNYNDFYFNQEIAYQATRQSIKDELIAAIEYVKTGKDYKEEELGLDYSQKNARIRDYIKYYQNKQGDLNNYTDEYIDQDIEQILTNIKKGKESKNYLNIEERIATIIAARYVATLNDVEFMSLILDTNLITKEQYESLTRKYRDIKDLKGEAYIQSNWKDIANLQKKRYRKYT